MTKAGDMDGAAPVLRFEFELEAPLAKVWRALTVPELVERWLPARPGTETPGAAVKLDVIDSEQDRWIRYRWHEGRGSLCVDSVVTFRVTPGEAGGTRLAIVHAPARTMTVPVPSNANGQALMRAA